MSKRALFSVIIAVVVMGAAIRLVLPALQASQLAWLIVVTIGAPWIVWECAKNLYTAWIHGYVLTGVPERRVYRDEDWRIFRNAVVASIVFFPILVAGAVTLLLDVWEGAI